MSNYEAVNIADMMEESERLVQDNGGGDFLNNFIRMPEKEGFVVVRLMPPAKGCKLYCSTRTHRLNNKSIHCPRILTKNKQGKKVWQDANPNEPCVVCKYYSELWKQSESLTGKAKDDMQNESRKFKPVPRYYYNAIARTETDPKTGEVSKNVGPKILSICETLHNVIVEAFTGNELKGKDPLGDVTDFKTGRDFKIIKSLKKGPNGTYPVYDGSGFEQPSSAGDKDQIEKWTSNFHDLAALRAIKTNEEIKIELKKHLGIIKTDNATFDLSEFQKKSENTSIEQQVQAAKKVVSQTPAAPSSAPAPSIPSDDAVLAEEDFLAELKDSLK